MSRAVTGAAKVGGVQQRRPIGVQLGNEYIGLARGAGIAPGLKAVAGLGKVYGEGSAGDVGISGTIHGNGACLVEAAAAEERLQKLNEAGTQSWSALTGALAETRAAFDRANQAARDAFKKA